MSRITITLTAVWYVAPFPRHGWIRCIAPESFCRYIGTATIVPCSNVTSVRIEMIRCYYFSWLVRIIRWPCLTGPSAHSRIHRSSVHEPDISPFTFWQSKQQKRLKGARPPEPDSWRHQLRRNFVPTWTSGPDMDFWYDALTSDATTLFKIHIRRMRISTSKIRRIRMRMRMSLDKGLFYHSECSTRVYIYVS